MVPRGPSLGRSFAALWWAATVSFVGDGVLLAAVPLVAAHLTRSPLLIATTQVARGLPWLLFGPFGGVVADRVDRRWAMVIVDVMRTVAVGALSIAVAGDWATMPLVLAVAFVLGAGEVFFDPAAQALVPNVVPLDRLEDANGRLYASESSAKELVGPAVGGVLFAAAMWAPFLVDAASFGLAALIVVQLSGSYRPTRAQTGRPTVARDLREGWRWLRANQLLWSFAIFGAVGNFAAAAVEGTLVVFAQRVLHLDGIGFGLLLATAAIGGTIAAVLAGKVFSAGHPGTIYIAANGAGGVAMLVAAATNHGVVCAALFAIVFAANAFGNILSISLRGELVPDDLRGRVNAIFRTMLWAVWPIGALVGGALANSINARAPITLFGISSIAIALAAVALANDATIAAARNRAAR